MKQGLLRSYFSGIVEQDAGEGYANILGYFLPEFVSAFLLYSLPFWVDALFVSSLESTSMYATLGSTNNLIHFIIKIAESISVGIIILAGQYNGVHEYQKVGHVLRDTFWSTCLIGFFISGLLYGGAYYIYIWYNVDYDMISMGIPFLRLRAIGLFFTFIYMALVGFLRGIKNTRIPMLSFVVGSLVFLLFDYLFIFGHCGFSRMELQGSALASIVQYVVMSALVLGFILYSADCRKYGISLVRGIGDFTYILHLIKLSWPVMLDKATMAWAYIWLCKMINPLGQQVVASFCVVKDIERFAFLPAIAFAQVITFLVSNDYSIQEWSAIKSNLKKVCFLASTMVATILLIFSTHATYLVRFFDKKGEFTALAAWALPILSVLVLFDLVQLILSGALRGAGNVKIVMYVRLAVCFGYFVPISYLISHMNINESLKFILVYGSFYVGNALMSIVYVSRLRGEAWKEPSLKGSL